MYRSLFCVGVVAGALFLLGNTNSAPSQVTIRAEVEPTASFPGIENFPSPDTIRSSIPAGTPLVRSLPGEVNGARVTRYGILEGPALSGVAGRSFTWITRGTSPGTYDIRLLASHPDAAPDTLVMQIEIEE